MHAFTKYSDSPLLPLGEGDKLFAVKRLSIVICTHNRCALLRDCLASLEKQTANPSLYEVIIVDNGSTDGTRAYLLEIIDKHPEWIVVDEPRIGLSHARNTGWKRASTDWILFMDDDALAAEHLAEHALWLETNTDFECIGGVFKEWLKYGKPKWIPDGFFNKSYYPDKMVVQDRRITGCIMIMRKQFLIDFGGFDPELGMKGNRTQYGEERELVGKALEAGRKLAVDPGLLVYHVVSPYKMRLRWLLLSRFRMGYYHGMQRSHATGYFLRMVLAELLRILLFLPRSVWKWLVVRDYYWQNMVFEIFANLGSKLGRLQGSFVARFLRFQNKNRQ